MVDPEVPRVAPELAARGTDPSPLEAVLEPVPAEPPEAEGESPEASAPDEAPAPAEPPSGEAPAGAPSVETLYEVLGVSTQASREQIEKAHRFCLDMYREGALATYSLLDAGAAEAARRRISFAYEVLADPERRREYDLSLGLTPAPAPAVPFSLRGPQEASAAAATPELPSGPLTGADLKRIRESRGIALREIAVSSKIGLRFLEYIEEDRFKLLPPTVYLRGFLQEYARILGLDPRRAAEAYMSRLPVRE